MQDPSPIPSVPDVPAADDLARLLAQAQTDPDILAVILFGSRARGEAGPNSDVDVCLVMNAASQADVSLKRLAYLQHAGLDLHIFQALPIYIRQRVLRDAHVLHVKDEDALYDLAFRTVREFEDFRPRYYDYLEEIAHGGS